MMPNASPDHAVFKNRFFEKLVLKSCLLKFLPTVLSISGAQETYKEGTDFSQGIQEERVHVSYPQLTATSINTNLKEGNSVGGKTITKLTSVIHPVG